MPVVLCFGTTDFQRLLSRPALIAFGPVVVGICFGLASARFAAAIINTPFTELARCDRCLQTKAV